MVSRIYTDGLRIKPELVRIKENQAMLKAIRKLIRTDKREQSRQEPEAGLTGTCLVPVIILKMFHISPLNLAITNLWQKNI